MKKRLFFFGLFLTFLMAHILYPVSDGKEIESRLSGTVGKKRLELLSQLINRFQNKEPKKILEYGKEALQLLDTFPDRKLEIVILNRMSTAGVLLGDFWVSAEYAGKSRVIAQKIGDRIGEADALHNLGRIYWNQSRYQETRDCLDKAENIYREMGDQKGLAKAFRLRSSIYWKMGEFSRAQEYIFKSLNIYEILEDQRGIAEAKNICGIVSAASGEYQDGLSYFSEANQLYETLDDKGGVAHTLNNIGLTYCRMGKPSGALEYFNKSLKISRQLGSKQLTGTVLSSIGEAYAQMEQHRKALDYFSQSLEINQTQDDSMGFAYNLIQIGKSKRKLRQYREARQLLERALEIARSINIKNEIKAAAKELSEISDILGDHQKAVDYYQEYKNIDEEIFKEISRKKMLEIQTLYETDQKEKELTLLKKNQQIQQLELDKQKTFMNSVLFIALLILLLVFAVYTLYRLKIRTTQTLSKEIREHKQTAQQLRESEEKFRTLAEKSVVGISIIQDQVIRYANPAFLKVFGCTFEDVVGQSPLTLVMEEDRALVMERLNQPILQEAAAHSTAYEFRGLTKEGKPIHLESYSVKTLYQGQPALLETIIDITHRKKTEAELLKMRKLESMGTLAGSIARDFHHLLSLVTTDAETLKWGVQYDANLLNWVENIEKTAFKATDLAQKLITFSKGGGAEPRKADFASILKNTFDTYPQMKKWVGGVSIPRGLKTIYGDERELTQIISSLLWNAHEAKNNGKEVIVTITAQNTIIPPVNTVSLKAGEYVEIVITDNGKGIPSHQLDKVFDPYFSTKQHFSQKGMGLGLAICYSIIKKHNGHISLKSEPGKGTTVDLILPAYKSRT
jgi:PAS domain S-box-containing protein